MPLMIKQVLRRLLGERAVGTLEFMLKPRLKESWGGPFNGQAYRQRIYADVMERFPFKAIVETGTFRGTTTMMFVERGLPVYTVEASPRFHAYARLRLRKVNKLVHLYQADSRAFLDQLAHDPTVPHSDVFFYLDAHWEQDLPLREEVAIIFSNWERAVVMVDDFEVPDSAYTFDDYGVDKALTLDYLAPLAHFNIQAYFPAVPAEEETGARRGSVVLCNDPEVTRVLDSISTLRVHPAERVA